MGPVFESEKAYAERFTDAEFWQPHIEQVLRRHGFPLMEISAAPPGTNPVFFSGRHVVKLFTPYFNGDVQRGREERALAALSRRPDTRSPRLLAQGELFADEEWPWPYVVTEKVPGAPLNQVWADMGIADRHALAREIGAALKAVHETSLEEAGLSAADFDLFLRKQRADLENRIPAMDLPRPLAQSLLSFVDRQLGCPMRIVLLHADAGQDHIFVDEGRLSALIDYGDVKAGPAEYEWVTALFDTFRGDKALLLTALEAYGCEPLEPGLLMSLTLLHEWRIQPREELKHLPWDEFATWEEAAEAIWSTANESISQD